MRMSKLILISHKLCPYVQRARIVLEEKTIPHEIRFIDLSAKPSWFLEISPLGKVPVLLVDEEPIFESSVIVEFLDEVTPGTLLPSDPLQKARSRAWMEYASSTLAAISGFYSALDQRAFDHATSILRHRFHTLDAATICGPYYNGHEFSLVDAAFAPVFRYFDVIDPAADFGFFADTPRISAWRDALRRRPSVQAAVVSDYAERLTDFLVTRDSVLASVIVGSQVA